LCLRHHRFLRQTRCFFNGRWGSATPVRVAEIKAKDKDEDAPDLDGEDYALVVYNVPLKGAMFISIPPKCCSKGSSNFRYYASKALD
jgi:hypothetical protein